MDSADISVILTGRNVGENLPKVLAHLEQQTHPAGLYEIVYVDTGSTDETLRILERHAVGSAVPLRVHRTSSVSSAAARNFALRQAAGEWVIFMDPSLLASPRLVEQHMRMQQQHGGRCIVVGRIEAHPQIPVEAVARYLTALSTTATDNQPLRFVDWRCWNLSAPRAVLLEAQGFDESFELPGLDDVELAWRLERTGVQGFFCETATAYTWVRPNADEEMARRYAEGFTLRRALEKTQSEMLANRYPGVAGASWLNTGRVIAPLYHRVCQSIANHTRSYDWVCRRMGRYAALQGYYDASRGRPPRYRAIPSRSE